MIFRAGWEIGNYGKGVVRKPDKIDGRSNVLKPTADFLESRLTESEISGSTIQISRKACFTKLCQFGAHRRCYTEPIIVRDLFECLEPRDMVNSPFIGDHKREANYS